MSFAADSAPSARWTAMLAWCPFWVAIFLVALVLPSEFSFFVGTLRLTPYRVVLLVTFVPCLFRLLQGGAGSIGLVDVLVMAHVVWCYIVFAVHHGGSVALESGGIRMLELGGAYLIARVYIVDERSFRGAVAVLLALLSLLLPFVLVESLTGYHAIRDTASRIMGSGSFSTGIDRRFGLARAFGPFDHPILMGVFAASAFGLTRLRGLPRVGLPRGRRFPVIATIGTALSSVSSGALAALIAQIGLLVWERFTRHISGRWKILSLLVFIAYMAVDVISNRSGYHVFLHYLTFSQHTAYNRIIIFRYGIQDVWNNPLLGIGFNVWSKPSWMHSTSMDNFWLVQAVTFGLPGFFTVATAVILILSARWDVLPPRLARLRAGWTISVIGMVVAACTVHFWNNLFSYFFLLIGAGSWFLRARPIQLGKLSGENR